MDALDKKIITVMQADCRKSFREIAKDVNSTTVTVINRIKKLQESGVIKGYSVDIDYSKVGLDLTGIISIIASDRESLKKLEKELSKHSNIVAVYEVTGETDVMVIGKFKSVREIQNFVKDDILASGSAKKTITSITTSIYKEDCKIDF